MDMTVTAARQEEEAPDTGYFLLWILVWSELAAFGMLLAAFMVTGIFKAQAFAAAQLHLNAPLAALNTAVLLTSGWQAACAARPGIPHAIVRRSLVFAALLGLGFVVIKIFEYSGEVAHAGNPGYGVFFELYFLLTGFHLLHVLFGSMVLLLVSWKAERSNVVLMTTLWHVFDLIWIVMFPIVYLV